MNYPLRARTHRATSSILLTTLVGLGLFAPSAEAAGLDLPAGKLQLGFTLSESSAYLLSEGDGLVSVSGAAKVGVFVADRLALAVFGSGSVSAGAGDTVGGGGGGLELRYYLDTETLVPFLGLAAGASVTSFDGDALGLLQADLLLGFVVPLTDQLGISLTFAPGLAYALGESEGIFTTSTLLGLEYYF